MIATPPDTSLWLLIGLTLAYVTHYLSIATWLGVMLFNLIIGFPMHRRLSGSLSDYAQRLAHQGTRAAPWLYLLVASTALSGWAIAWLKGALAAGDFGYALGKSALLVLMLLAHVYATVRLWPRLMFALEHEVAPLTRGYALSIGVSAAVGIVAVAASALWLVLGEFGAHGLGDRLALLAAAAQ